MQIFFFVQNAMSSTERNAITFYPSTLTPTYTSSFISIIVSSIYILNQIGDKMHYCLTPLPILATFSIPSSWIWITWFLYRLYIILQSLYVISSLFNILNIFSQIYIIKSLFKINKSYQNIFIHSNLFFYYGFQW